MQWNLSKAELDLNFLGNCQSFNVFPKFLSFNLPNTNRRDTITIRKQLLRSAIAKRSKEHRKLIHVRDQLATRVQGILNSVDFYILNRTLHHNVTKATTHVVGHTIRSSQISHATSLSLSHLLNETVTNVSSHSLTSEQLNILKFGLTHSIRPPKINESDVFTCFELINHTMAKKLRDTKQAGKLVADLSRLAHNYVSSYRPTIEDLKKLRVLKEIRKNKNIVILKPDKRNGVVVLNRSDCDQGILKIINDTSKFRPIKEDPTLLREGRLQRLLRKFKKDGHLDDVVYENIYPKGSQQERIYGLPKMHKDRGPNSTPPFRTIVSSIGTYKKVSLPTYPLRSALT